MKLDAKQRNKKAREIAAANPETIADAAMGSEGLEEALSTWGFHSERLMAVSLNHPQPPITSREEQVILIGYLISQRQKPSIGDTGDDLVVNAKALCQQLARLPDPSSTDHLSLLTRVVEDWQRWQLPNRNQRSTGILGKDLTRRQQYGHGWLTELKATTKPRPGRIRETQTRFGFLPDTKTKEKPTLLAIYDEFGGPSGRQRGITPHVMRIFTEVLLEIPTQARDGYRHGLPPITIKEIWGTWLQRQLKWWNPKQGRWKSNYARKHQHELETDLYELHNLAIPIGEHSGFYRAIVISAVSGFRLDDKVRFEVMLPATNKVGAWINRSVLRSLGKMSEPAYRAYLSLVFDWERYAMHGGRLIRPTRPAVERDKTGIVLNAHRNRLIGHNGQPIRNPYDKRAVRTGEREPNPARTRYPEYDNYDLVHLAYSEKVLMKDKTPAARRVRKQRTKKAIELIAKAGGCTIEKSYRGKIWRIMAPDYA